jgi:hypothetical protein
MKKVPQSAQQFSTLKLTTPPVDAVILQAEDNLSPIAEEEPTEAESTQDEPQHCCKTTSHC